MLHGFLSLLVVSLSVSAVTPGARVSTTSGTLNGFTNGTVNTFLGVPYGLPPVGDLRWRHSVPVNVSGTEVNTTKFGPGCGQLVIPGIPWSSPLLPSVESEDCLSLNIWAPRDGNHLPILVFAPGGGYQLGTSSSPSYDGHHIAKTGRAIFVSLNYRLNIFGFPSTTPIPSEIDQNVGITDSRLAVEWIAKNIAQFGGDPSRIIITGQSAGAHLINTHVYAYENNPIAAGQILASGAIGMLSTAPADGVFWNNISDILGCGNTTNASQIACMRNASFDDVKSAALKINAYFNPSADGSIIFTNDTYLARAANGSFAHIPALLTATNNEGSLFVEPYSSVYPNGTTADVASDVIVCPGAREAAAKHHAGVPTWRTRYMAVWDNLAIFPDDPNVGAYHGSDIPIIFGTFADPAAGVRNGTVPEAERKLSALYMDAWLTFAENPKDGLSRRRGWPEYDPKGHTLGKIGVHNSSSVMFGPSTQYDSTCPK